MLLIAGDLFHRQPLLRELKEVDSIFATLSETEVVLIAGNHDYIKQGSYYHSFSWCEHVTMLSEEHLEYVELPKLQTAVYGFSYWQKEITKRLYDHAMPKQRQKIEILLAHGGDESHIPIQKSKLVELGYDYIALGHIHKPQMLVPNKIAYAGALEPLDKNDTGTHGYIKGEILKKDCSIAFVPSAAREYVHQEVIVDEETTGFTLKNKIKEMIEARGVEHIYKLILTGYRAPDMLFELGNMDVYGNIIEVQDMTKPAYDFEELYEQNRTNIIGAFVKSFKDAREDSVEYQALCEGVEALMETKRG